MKHTFSSSIIACLALFSLATAALAANISPTGKYAWSETAGWLNFAPSGGGVTVYADHLEGFAWSENIGWIKLGSHSGGGSLTYANTSNANWGVNRSGTTLSGFAWSETSGWINFAPTGGGVTLNETTGAMSGLAWGENIGWIKIRNASPAYGVRYLPTFGVSTIVFDGATGYAAQDGGGIWKTSDKGATWVAASSQPVNQRIRGLAIHPVSKTTLYAASYGGGIYTSSDSGVTWSACSGQPTNLNATTLALDRTGILYAGTERGIYTSADCLTWSAANSGLTVDAGKPPLAIAIDPAAPSKLYAGFDGAGIFRSADSGANWSPAASQPGNLRIKALVMDKSDSSKLFAASYGDGVFTSVDDGDHWSPCVNSGLTNKNVLSLTIDASGRLYAGTEGGVFVSTDNCATWMAINSGLP